jgi:hypothetical protein
LSCLSFCFTQAYFQAFFKYLALHVTQRWLSLPAGKQCANNQSFSW